jgi:DNA replication protein DnaD
MENNNKKKPTGWIRLHRTIEKHWLYPTGEFTKYEAWIDLLLCANHTENKVVIGNKIFICKRGQSLRSLKTLAERWNWSREKVRRYLSLLQKDNMIESKSVSKSTQITICNYEHYNGERDANETQARRKRYTNKNEYNNDKEGNYKNLEKNIIPIVHTIPYDAR